MQVFQYGSMQNNLQKAAVRIGPLVCQGIKPMKMLEHELKELLKESIMGIEDKSKFPKYHENMLLLIIELLQVVNFYKIDMSTI